MKKTYIRPQVEVIHIESTSILAASTLTYGNEDVNTSIEGQQLSREDRGISTPNLWDQQW